ncbi:MAG: hypothetical protein ACLUKN_02300 [Bacilli bacterium]
MAYNDDFTTIPTLCCFLKSYRRKVFQEIYDAFYRAGGFCI